MLAILLFVPGDYAGPCFIGFAIGESLGAAALRIAGGIFTKIADIGSDLMKIVFNIKEDDVRNPGVIADCTGDNAGDSVGPTADGFETYGVTGVALITFILLAVSDPAAQIQLLVWIFVMRVMMVVTSAVSYWINEAMATRPLRQRRQDELRGAADLPGLAHLDRLGRRHLPGLLPADPRPRRRHAVVEALVDHHLRHARRRDHPRAGQGLHLDRVEAREGDRHLVARGRRLAQHPVGPRRRQLQRLLDGPRHPVADGRRVPRQPAGPGRDDARPGGVRVRPGGLRLPGHGPGDDRGRLLRAGHRQRAVGLRAVDHRGAAQHQGRDQEGLRLRAGVRPRQALPGGQRRRRQHLQGHRQAGADRHRGGRRHDADLLAHPDPHRRADQGHGAALDPPPALPARPDHGRRRHLLVHRRGDPGGRDRRLPRGRVHQAATSGSTRPPRRPRSPTARRWSRSAPSTRRRACSTSS